MNTGSCLCGGIKFEIVQEIGPIRICHCRQCRKAQGSAIATNFSIQKSNFKFVSGNELLSSFKSSSWKERCFCIKCGSPIFSRTTRRPEIISIRAGTLDGDLSAKPVGHCHVAYKANWLEITDNLPQYPERFPSTETNK